ncbi:SRPBCC family protein [Actinocorallia aurea]
MTTSPGAPAAPATQVAHRIDVAAPADAVYRIIANVSLWPLYFPPTVRAERVSGDDAQETVRIWAIAQGGLRSWESHRSLDAAALTVSFAQTRPQAPVAEMSGRWWISETGDGCAVTLDHTYRAIGDDPAAHDLIAAAVDANSLAELARLKHAAELGAGAQGLVFDFADTEEMTCSQEEAYAFINEADLWPQRLPHVARLDLREDGDGLQYMEMDTRSPDGSVHTTVSYRVCEPSHRVVYKQTILPKALQAHNGEWLFATRQDGTVAVTARHQVMLDPVGIASLPMPPASLEAARDAVRQALGANSRATMVAARAFYEAARAGAGDE